MCISKISHSSHSHRFNVITVEFDLQRGGHGALLCWLFSNVVMQWIKLHLALPWWNPTLWYTCTMIALITINIFGSTSQSCSWIFIQTKFAWRCVNKYVQEKIYKCQQYWHKDNYKHYDVLIVWKSVDIWEYNVKYYVNCSCRCSNHGTKYTYMYNYILGWQDFLNISCSDGVYFCSVAVFRALPPCHYVPLFKKYTDYTEF